MKTPSFLNPRPQLLYGKMSSVSDGSAASTPLGSICAVDSVPDFGAGGFAGAANLLVRVSSQRYLNLGVGGLIVP